jgi:hypothetical protein
MLNVAAGELPAEILETNDTKAITLGLVAGADTDRILPNEWELDSDYNLIAPRGQKYRLEVCGKQLKWVPID